MALQTKDFSVTGVSAGGGITYTYILRVTQNSTNIAANSSNLTVQAILKQNYAGTAFHTWFTGVSCSLNGRQIFSDYEQRSLSGTAEHVYYTWTGDVSHNPDGNMLLTVAGSFWQSTYESYSPPAMTVPADTMVLTPVFRGSAITATDANIGESTSVAIQSAVANYHHSVAYRFGELTGYIIPQGGTSPREVLFSERNISWMLPTEFYYQIPDRSRAECTLTCRTYSGGTLVGTQTTEFAAIASMEQTSPSLDAQVEDVNEKTLALTGDPFMLIRYHSTARCIPNATAKYGASVTLNQVNGRRITDGCRDMPKVETDTFEFYMEDSRGRAATQTVEVPMIAYTRLSCQPAIRRLGDTSNDVLLELTGSYYPYHFGNIENTLTVSYRINSRAWVEVPVDISPSGSFSAAVQIGGLDYDTAYTMTVVAEDCLERVSRKLQVQQGLPLFNWNKQSFDFHIPVSCPKGISGAFFRSVRVHGTDRFRLQSKYSAWDAGGNRQSFLIFGSRNGVAVLGVLMLHSSGAATWSGSPELTVNSDSGGKLTVILGGTAYDQFFLASAEAFEVI